MSLVLRWRLAFDLGSVELAASHEAAMAFRIPERGNTRGNDAGRSREHAA